MMWHDDQPRLMTPREIEAMTQHCIRVTYRDDMTPVPSQMMHPKV
jgi:hypothetical protein